MIQLINKLGVIDSIVTGIKLWLVPQISEHCPKNKPGRLIRKLAWFSRPGVASALIPKEGIVQAWITSVAVIKIRILVFKGIITRLSVSIRRKFIGGISFWGIINESNLIFLKSAYSYDQYHWWPVVFKVIEGLLFSSIKYNSLSDGRAIKIKIIAGKIVQINSIICSSNKSRLVNLLKNNVVIKYEIKMMINVRIINVKSWKKIICSIKGEDLSWKFKFDHVGISKER